MNTLTTIKEPCELAHRANDSLAVTLFWIRSTNRLLVSAIDQRNPRKLPMRVT